MNMYCLFNKMSCVLRLASCVSLSRERAQNQSLFKPIHTQAQREFFAGNFLLSSSKAAKPREAEISGTSRKSWAVKGEAIEGQICCDEMATSCAMGGAEALWTGKLKTISFLL